MVKKTKSKKLEEKPEVVENEAPPKFVDFLRENEIYTNESGEEFAYFRGLYRVADEQIGIIGNDTEVVQSPEKKNKWSATVRVKIKFKDGTYATAAADCRYTTAGEGFQNYTTALAETRAFARALRRKLQVGLCSFEEQYTPETHAITDTQMNCIQKKFIDRALFGLEDVSKIVGKEVVDLKNLNGKEASTVIMQFNKSLKKKQMLNSDKVEAKKALKKKKKKKKKVKKDQQEV
jgi:hypothetical protein